MATCPDCGSSTTKSAGTSTFQFVSNKKCKDCGAVWTPPCPLWGAVIAIILGGAGCLVGLAIVPASFIGHVNGQLTLRFGGESFLGALVGLAIAAVGFGMARYGVGATRGTRGQLKLITPGASSGNSTDEAS